MTALHSASRRDFIKTLGAAALTAPFITSDLLAAPPSRTLRHASFGADGMALSDLTQISHCKNVEIAAVCDVDLNRMGQARKLFPNARFYQDWRELLDKEAKNIDSVNVSTPDHMHAPIAMSAMQLGKHVYGQKPLAHNIHETRQLTAMAAKNRKLVTQMGIQIHASIYYRMAVRLMQEGAIGKIKEVHSWVDKSWGDATARPDRADPVPANFNWDFWLGISDEQPFIGNGYYHPGTWRKRLDFGTGTLGDMGCHIFDPLFEGIGLSAPLSIRSEGPAPNRWNWGIDGKVCYTFAGNKLTASRTLPVTWYDGAAKPPAEVLALMEGEQSPDGGSILIGTEGTMLLPHFSLPTFFPTAKFKEFKFPKVKGHNHWSEFTEACLGNGKTTADFAYSGPLTEAILLGGIASRFPKTTLKWDAKKMRFNVAEANQYIRRTYRKGWEVKGLS